MKQVQSYIPRGQITSQNARMYRLVCAFRSHATKDRTHTYADERICSLLAFLYVYRQQFV